MSLWSSLSYESWAVNGEDSGSEVRMEAKVISIRANLVHRGGKICFFKGRW